MKTYSNYLATIASQSSVKFQLSVSWVASATLSEVSSSAAGVGSDGCTRFLPVISSAVLIFVIMIVDYESF